jgi:hypothetical protein
VCCVSRREVNICNLRRYCQNCEKLRPLPWGQSPLFTLRRDKLGSYFGRYYSCGEDGSPLCVMRLCLSASACETSAEPFFQTPPISRAPKHTLGISKPRIGPRNRPLFSRPLVILRRRRRLSEKVPNLFAPLQFVACQLFLRAHLAARSKGSFYFVSLKEALEQSDSGPSRVSTTTATEDGAAAKKSCKFVGAYRQLGWRRPRRIYHARRLFTAAQLLLLLLVITTRCITI